MGAAVTGIASCRPDGAVALCWPGDATDIMMQTYRHRLGAQDGIGSSIYSRYTTSVFT